MEIEVLILSSFSDERIMRKYGKIKKFVSNIEIYLKSFFLMRIHFLVLIIISLNIFTLYEMNYLQNFRNCLKWIHYVQLFRYVRNIWNIHKIYKWSIKCYDSSLSGPTLARSILAEKVSNEGTNLFTITCFGSIKQKFSRTTGPISVKSKRW